MDVDTDDDFIKWSVGKDPVIPERTFTGVSGHLHGFDPNIASPFDFFCLRIPIYFYTRFANYTNKKLSWSLPQKMGMYMIGRPLVQLKSERGLLQLCGIA